MSIQMIIFWSVVLTFLSLNQTNDLDIRFIAARLGRVPVYCLPTVLFLTLRPSPLPNVLYLSLLPVHKWLSRIIILQSLLHTICYFYLYVVNGTLSKFQKFDNLNGFVAMIAFMIIILTSLPCIRRRFYNFFFINHYICTWIVTITLYFHVRPGIPYLTLLNCLILLFQIYYKIKMSKISKISTFKISDNMVLANLPNDSISQLYNLPGSHVRLIDYNENQWRIWNYLKLFLVPIQHPYTLASLPVDKSQKLIIRVGNYKLVNNKSYFITGAYLPHLAFIENMKTLNHIKSSNNLSHHVSGNSLNSLLVKTQVKKCLIVVGGSAISFALPILRVLNYNGSMVKIIWIIRDHEDLKVLDYFKNYLINDDCIDIFITGSYTVNEKVNFKDALADLHRNKMELEIKQENEILSGGYSYYNTNSNEIDFNTTQSNNNTISLDSLEDPASNIQNLNKPGIEVKTTTESESAITELTPLNISFNIPSYGVSSFHSSLHPMHRKSCIEFRNHNKESSDSYNTETVDIELNEQDIYKNNLPVAIPPNIVSSPTAGLDDINDKGYSSGPESKISSSTTNNSQSNINPSSATLVNKNLKSKKSTNFNDLLKKLNSISPKPSIPTANNSSINQKLFNKHASTTASSVLYDDLEDYWVLKSSFSRIEFGRPKLGLYYYSWCIGSSCSGPLVSLQNGQSICYNMREDPSSVYNDQINELYSNDTFIANRNARFKEKGGRPDETIWVIGAGPSGLVDNVRLWANDCGFSFHEESFIV